MPILLGTPFFLSSLSHLQKVVPQAAELVRLGPLGFVPVVLQALVTRLVLLPACVRAGINVKWLCGFHQSHGRGCSFGSPGSSE